MRRLLMFSMAGFIAQAVDGSLGMGYGMTSTSVLVGMGTAAALASASVHLAEVGTALASGVSHHRFGNVDWLAVRWMAIPGAVGAFVGALALSRLSAEVATPWVALVLALLGVYVLIKTYTGRSVGDVVRHRRHRRRFYAGLGGVAGFMDAAGGGGWGPIGTSTLMAAGKMEPRRVIGTISTSEFLVSLGASIGFLIALPWHAIDPRLVGALLIGGVVAAPVAAWLTQHLDRKILGMAAGWFIVGANLRTLVGALGAPSQVTTAMGIALAVAWVVVGTRLGFHIVRARRRQPATVVTTEAPTTSATPSPVG